MDTEWMSALVDPWPGTQMWKLVLLLIIEGVAAFMVTSGDINLRVLPLCWLQVITLVMYSPYLLFAERFPTRVGFVRKRHIYLQYGT